jgi:rare lipoprotein A (peptidoglycan hydrolase)
MIQSAVRFLPGAAPVLASMMLMAGAAEAARPAPSGGGAGWEESGEASWYGGYHNGRRTSSGRIFDDREMTAAHATLPLGTRIRVTVQETGKSVVVTVTDRQPYKPVRVIDLSRGAASRVGLLSRGTAMVTLATLRADDVEVAESPAVQVAADETAYESAGMEASGAAAAGVSDAYSPRHGRQRMHREGRAAAVGRPCCRAPSVVQVRRSVQHQAGRRML